SPSRRSWAICCRSSRGAAITSSVSDRMRRGGSPPPCENVSPSSGPGWAPAARASTAPAAPVKRQESPAGASNGITPARGGRCTPSPSSRAARCTTWRGAQETRSRLRASARRSRWRCPPVRGRHGCSVGKSCRCAPLPMARPPWRWPRPRPRMRSASPWRCVIQCRTGPMPTWSDEVTALGAKPRADERTAGRRAPNIVLVHVDDLGWTDLGCYGSSFYETPRLDALAAGSCRLENAYAASPVCSPSRAALLTGRVPARVGVTQWIGGTGVGELLDVPYHHALPVSEYALPRALRDGGYATWHVGKWHLGDGA